jgi:hypothetical protein
LPDLKHQQGGENRGYFLEGCYVSSENQLFVPGLSAMFELVAFVMIMRIMAMIVVIVTVYFTEGCLSVSKASTIGHLAV